METYKKLTPPEKRACRKYIVQSFKRHNVKKINNNTGNPVFKTPNISLFRKINSLGRA